MKNQANLVFMAMLDTIKHYHILVAVTIQSDDKN
jgi:hypothetical protein